MKIKDKVEMEYEKPIKIIGIDWTADKNLFGDMKYEYSDRNDIKNIL